jgi:hypothetical protein
MLYITYNADNYHSDGMGAQYQRMIAIISLCNYCKNGNNIEYVHTPITKIEHVSTDLEVYQIEKFFGFSKTFTNVNDISVDEIIEMNVISDFKVIIELSKKSKQLQKNILLKTALIFGIVERYIYMYENTIGLLRSICSPSPSTSNYKPGKNVAVHIRRGDVTLNTTDRDILVRFTPVEYYKSIILKLQLKEPGLNFYIFTELTVENQHEFEIFREIPNVEIISNNLTLDTFQHLINADILVTSKSSFSYISAFYNPNMVYYVPFWHQPLSHWIKL